MLQRGLVSKWVWTESFHCQAPAHNIDVNTQVYQDRVWGRLQETVCLCGAGRIIFITEEWRFCQHTSLPALENWNRMRRQDLQKRLDYGCCGLFQTFPRCSWEGQSLLYTKDFPSFWEWWKNLYRHGGLIEQSRRSLRRVTRIHGRRKHKYYLANFVRSQISSWADAHRPQKCQIREHFGIGRLAIFQVVWLQSCNFSHAQRC